MSSAPWIQSSGEYRRENECVFVDGSIITHYQISLTNAAVGTRLKFHSSDRFLMRYPLDVFTSGHLRVFLLFCAFSECQWGPNIYIYIGLHCLLLCRLKNQWEHLHFGGNYIFTRLPCLKSSLGETFDRVSFVMMSFSVAFIAQVIGSQKMIRNWESVTSSILQIIQTLYNDCYNKQSPAGCAQYSNSVLKCTKRQKTHSVMS